MKLNKEKIIDKPLRLPQINCKTSTSFSTQETKDSRIRPSSSSKLNDLEKNLFAQLSQYDDIDKKNIKKSKTKKQIEGDGIKSKQLSADWVELQAPYLKKLQKIMPQTYMKLLQSKKPQPLQEITKTKQKKQNSIQQNPTQSRLKTKKLAHEHSHSSSLHGDSQPHSQKQQKRQSSFTVAQRQVQQIFQQYLEQEGLNQFVEIKSEDLKELNQQLDQTEADINSLKKSMYDIIGILGNQCINIQ